MAIEQFITSRDNPRLMAARRVRDGRDKFRIFIEGRRLAEEAIRSGVRLTECFVSDEFAEDDLVSTVSAPVFRMPEKVFKTIADTETPQGIILIGERPKPVEREGRGELPVTVFLSEINNPSNLGAILRTAEAAGVRGVILSKGSTDPYAPKALRASMGSAFRLNLIEGATLAAAVEQARQNGAIITGANNGAEELYTNIDWTRPRLLVFGSEAHGLKDEEKSLLDEVVKIPMASQVESLNLAVSAGIILFEARRQLTSRG
jgi:TrmH family RNA methyltransferase